jgi:hypothetical protein
MPGLKKYGSRSFFRLKRLSQDRRVFIFLICLAISTFLWFLNALSKDYETTIVYPVKYINLPNNLYLANNPPTTFEMTIEAPGFTLIRNRLNLGLSPIVLDVDRITANAETPDKLTFRIRTVNLINRISGQINDEITIQEIRPESFVLVLDNIKSKLVKVEPNVNLEFAPQFNVSSKIRISPEYVTIYGPAILIDTIETIYTLPFKSDKIKNQVDELIGLVTTPKITSSPEKVRIIVPIEEFTEKKLSVPVSITGKPSNIKIKLFPSEIQVSFMVGLSKYKEITSSDFSASIPYSELKDGVANIPVVLNKKPGFINELKFAPQSVEFLIEK